MGLRFRKTVKICDGLKLNFGLKGASLTLGGHGLQKTFHTSGRTTTTVGLPGSGIYWTETDNPSASRSRPSPSRTKSNPTETPLREEPEQHSRQVDDFQEEPIAVQEANLPEEDDLGFRSPRRTTGLNAREIFAYCDEPVEWTEILAGVTADELGIDDSMYGFFREKASAVVAGDIEAYLDVIDFVKPVDDLLLCAGEFEFGTDSPGYMEVEFAIFKNAEEVRRLPDNALDELARAVAVRAARDVMALLPVSRVRTSVLVDGVKTIDITFHKDYLAGVNFNVASISEVFGATS